MSMSWAASQRGAPNNLAGKFPSFQINATNARVGNVKVEARSPSGRVHEMSISENGGAYTANFNPTEVGKYIFQSN